MSSENSIFSYEPSAYRSEQAKELYLAKPSHRAMVLNKSQDLWEVYPPNVLDSHEVDDLFVEDKEGGPKFSEKQIERFDAEMIRYPTLGKLNDKIFFVLLAGSVGALKLALIALFLFVVTGIFSGFIDGGMTEQFWPSFWETMYVGGVGIILPCIISAVICTPILLFCIKKFAKHVKPHFELNRRTGRVKQWCKKTNKLLYDVAFKDCVAETINISTHQGITDYHQVFLRCTTEPKLKIDIALFGDNKLGHDVTAIWNFIQRYMDTSRPLPDVPTFEISRHLDPVTAAHDKKIQRNPRYWRDMALKDLYEQKAQLIQAVRALPKFA
ncbi:alkaline shock response membrane anchor protein AmaP [Motilimonas sp. E26]|uniref:alkaline shock response membrane anchor protein AmaP n=1 Tax=Motilimonas sp. E26 TaxID=2865674 RepID=UPI001E617B08|nr:alkaline shock response membrane anchor protein AmaP [Motilimonas sp. E26]MCE0559393.1 hypothetical protein [Motilimonas sp. E26]